MRALLPLGLLLPSLALATTFPGGNLPANTTWTTADSPVQILGDLTIPNSVTLTVQPGVILEVATSDALGSGIDPTRVELIVASGGTLLIQGSGSSPVQITTTGGSGAWYGLRPLSGSTVTLENVTVNNPVIGLTAQTSVSFTNVTLENASQAALIVASGGSVSGSGCTLSGSPYGAELTGGTLSLSTSTISGNTSYGVYLSTNTSTASLDHSVVTGAEYAIYDYQGGAVSLTHDTISGASSYGVYLYYPYGNSVVRDSIIVNNGSYGVLGYANSNGTLTVDHVDAWGQSNNIGGVTPGAGEISSNPLFASGNYRITTNSPCRNGASDGSDLGAFAYAGDATPSLEGVLYSNTTLTGSQTVVGDLTVSSGVTLTLSAGANVSFASSDGMASGIDPNHVELINHGTLVVEGTASNPVTLGSSGGAGSWYGVRALSGSSATTLQNVTVDNAIIGLDAQASVTLTNVTLENASQVAMVSEGGGSVSASGSTFANSPYGIELTGGTVSLSTSTLSGNSSYGVYVSGNTSSASLDHCLITGSEYSVYDYQGGAVTLTHDTIAGASSYGVYLYYPYGMSVVRDSIIVNNGSYGVLGYANSNGTLTVDHLDAWGQSNNVGGVSPGSGEISGNPLFASGNYRITTNSPCRNAASDGTDLGAFAYAGDATPNLEGVLYTNTTLTGSQTVVGDLTVASGVTLTLAAGTTLSFATSDGMASGIDPNHAELINSGTLVIQGSASSPVTLQSSGGAGSWYGIRALTGSTTTLQNLTVNNGIVGLDAQATVSLNNVTLENASQAAMVVEANGSVSGSGSTFSGSPYGIELTGGSVSLTGSTLSGNSSYGVYLSSSTSSASLDHCLLTGAEYSVYDYQGGAVTLTHDTISGASSYGVYLYYPYGTSLVRDSIVVNNGSYGILAYANSNGTITVDHDDAWGQSNNVGGVTPGAGEISANPLFVSTTDYHLTITSPCRNAASDGSDLGAFPYQVGSLDHVTLSPPSASISAGALFGFGAQGYDINNNPIPNLTFTWTAASAAGTIDQTGLLTASCTPGTVNAGVTATTGGKSASANITVAVGPPAKVGISPSSATVAAAGAQTFSASVQDACGNTVSTGSVTWSTANGDGTITAAGVYTAPCTTGTFTGAVTAVSGGMTGHANVTVTAAQLANLTVAPQNPTVPSGGQQQFTASGSDSCGNPTSATPSWSVVNSGGSVSSNGLFTAGGNTGTFANTIQASANGIMAKTGVTVSAGSIASLTVSPSSVTLNQGAVQAFTVTALDSAGNPVTVTPTWSAVNGGGSVDASGNFTAGTRAGTFNATVQASADGLNATATVTVKPGAADHLTISPATATLAPNGSTAFGATVYDANNNITQDAVAWSVTVAAAGTITQGGVFTAGTAQGTYSNAIQATAGAATGTASVTLDPGALSQLLINPGTATVRAGGTVGFAVTGKDGNGNTVAVTPAWAVLQGGGTINAGSGIFTAGGTPGTFANTVQAQANGLAALATIVVQNGPVVQVAVAPSHPALHAGQSQTFTATPTDAYGNTVAGAAVTWTADPSAGTIDASGDFVAGSTPGDYANAVVATASGITGGASVQILSADGGFVTGDGGNPDAGDGMMCSGVCAYHAKSGCGCASAAGVAPFAAALLILLAALRRRAS